MLFSFIGILISILVTAHGHYTLPSAQNTSHEVLDVADDHQYMYTGVQLQNNPDGGFIVPNNTFGNEETGASWILYPRYVVQIGENCLSRAVWNDLRKPDVRFTLCESSDGPRFGDIRRWILKDNVLKPTPYGVSLSRSQLISLVRYQDWSRRWALGEEEYHLNLPPHEKDD